jgi:glycosyltransferase involved in cell wall biosynthesis
MYDRAAAARGAPIFRIMNHATLPDRMPDGSAWPRISVISPSYNQGAYLEEAICSVASQNYPNVEHIVIDGGSTDDSVEILQRHSSHLAYWESEPDRGQSHAINKGMARATGDILTWLNSDDRLAPGSLAAVALAFQQSKADLVAGLCTIFDQEGTLFQHMPALKPGPAVAPWPFFLSARGHVQSRALGALRRTGR